MMFYFTVIICSLSLLSGMICSSYENLDDTELQELLQHLEDTRNVNSRQSELDELQDLETKALAQRILTELANENVIQKATDGEADDDIEDVQSERWWSSCGWCGTKLIRSTISTARMKKLNRRTRSARTSFRRS